MSTIVTRASKGSALTWTEGDANITNLNNDKLENVVADTTPQLGGNLDVNGNSIVSTSNANITIAPDGTGNINLDADTVRVGDVNVNATITNNGTGALSVTHATWGQGLYLGNDGAIAFIPANGAGFALGDNVSTNPVSILSGSSGISLSTDSGNPSSITISGAANGNITLTPDGTGDVRLEADTVVVGDSAAAATITTNGAGNLTISTNAGTNSGTIVINQGANANIQFTPNGTGLTVASGTFLGTHTPGSAGSAPIIGRSAVTIDNSIRYNSANIQKHRTDILLAAMTNEPAAVVYSVRDSGNNNRNFASHRAVYQGTGTNPYFAFDVSVNGFTATTACVNFGGAQANWGSSGTYTHSTVGTTDLIFSTNNGTNSGTITILDGANQNITITPNGTGKIVLDGLSWPNADGTSGQVLSTNGAGVLSWATASGGSQPMALVTGSTDFYTGTKYINWTTEDYDPSGLVTVSNGTFTIASAGTYLIHWTTSHSMGDPNQWRLYNQTGAAALKTFNTAAFGGGSTFALVGGYSYVHTITASNVYRWDCPNTTVSAITNIPQMQIIKLA